MFISKQVLAHSDWLLRPDASRDLYRYLASQLASNCLLLAAPSCISFHPTIRRCCSLVVPSFESHTRFSDQL